MYMFQKAYQMRIRKCFRSKVIKYEFVELEIDC